MSVRPKSTMTTDEFLLWAEQQEDDYELVDGRLVAMGRDRAGHNVTKRAVVRALEDAIRRGGLTCVPYSDGIAVKTPTRGCTATRRLGRLHHFQARPAGFEGSGYRHRGQLEFSEKDDTGAKFTDYFSIASIAHYLIVFPEKRLVIHHARSGATPEGPTAITSIRRSGELHLDPPGLVLQVEELFPVEMAPTA